MWWQICKGMQVPEEPEKGLKPLQTSQQPKPYKLIRCWHTLSILYFYWRKVFKYLWGSGAKCLSASNWLNILENLASYSYVLHSHNNFEPQILLTSLELICFPLLHVTVFSLYIILGKAASLSYFFYCMSLHFFVPLPCKTAGRSSVYQWWFAMPCPQERAHDAISASQAATCFQEQDEAKCLGKRVLAEIA